MKFYNPLSNKIEEENKKNTYNLDSTLYLSTKEMRDKYRQEWLEEQIKDLQDKLDMERLKNGRLT